MRLFFFLIKIELEAAMGDADWEAETIRSSLYSHVPVFEKVVNLKFANLKFKCYKFDRS